MSPRAVALAAALLTCASCEGGTRAACDGATCHDAALFYQSCSGKVAAEIPPADCPSQGCGGKTAYALCEKDEWSRCACTLPDGYEVVDAGFFGVEGGAEAGD